ncbi:MAG: glycosyltransferase family 4 protein [Actinomycetia bacterium]|nr:glycosyltransferase family 4 protein [Actinomycetes bacterium]
MRIYIWHGYLLGGTGSNEYTRALAKSLSQQGHDVTVFSQEPNPAEFDLAGAHTIRPVLPGPLPVFVLDGYADASPALLTAMDRSEAEAFVAANAAAIREQGPADLLISNHVLLGGPVGAASGLPYIVKAHGSELEFAMRERSDLCAWASDSLQDALAVVAGSAHVEGVLRELLTLPQTQIVQIPPGVDTDQMAPATPDDALQQLIAECEQDVPNPADTHNERLPDSNNARRLTRFFADLKPNDRPVVYVGKLSQEKGVDLLLRAAAALNLPTLVVGFGPARPELESLAGPRTLFTGPLQHRHLCHLWPLMSASVVPSVFPEAFGMVAAEAAACGCPPLVAYHSGLAEIADGLATRYPEGLADLVSFRSGDEAALSDKLADLTSLPADQTTAVRAAARQTAVDLWSWSSVAQRLVNLKAG